jgi:hypothetical protein
MTDWPVKEAGRVQDLAGNLGGAIDQMDAMMGLRNVAAIQRELVDYAGAMIQIALKQPHPPTKKAMAQALDLPYRQFLDWLKP